MNHEQSNDQRSLDLCTYCPKLCRHTCPVSTALGNESLTPQAKMQLLNFQRHDLVQWDVSSVEPLFACTGCGHCQQYCKHHNDVSSVLWRGRAEARQRGLGHSQLTDLVQRFHQRTSRLQKKLQETLTAECFSGSGDAAWIPSSDAIAHDSDSALMTLHLLRRSSTTRVHLPTQPVICAGYPLLAGGFVDAFIEVAKTIRQTLSPFRRLIVSCPACVALLRNEYPRLGLGLDQEILHITEYLDTIANTFAIVQKLPPAYYHDSCYLARTLHVLDQPRRLLALCCTDVREFSHARENADCCGGGGLVPLTYPAAARLQALRRLTEPRLFNVDNVVTSCATCARTFRHATDRPRVTDMVDVIAWAHGESFAREAQSLRRAGANS